MLDGHVGGQRHDVAGGHHDVLRERRHHVGPDADHVLVGAALLTSGVAIQLRVGDHHRVERGWLADVESGHPRPERGHPAGALVPHHLARHPAPVRPGEAMDVGAADARRDDSEQDLPRSRARIGTVLHHQAAELGKHQCAHVDHVLVGGCPVVSPATLRRRPEGERTRETLRRQPTVAAGRGWVNVATGAPLRVPQDESVSVASARSRTGTSRVTCRKP